MVLRTPPCKIVATGDSSTPGGLGVQRGGGGAWLLGRASRRWRRGVTTEEEAKRARREPRQSIRKARKECWEDFLNRAEGGHPVHETASVGGSLHRLTPGGDGRPTRGQGHDVDGDFLPGTYPIRRR